MVDKKEEKKLEDMTPEERQRYLLGVLADTYMDAQDMRIRLNNRIRQEEYDEILLEFLQAQAKTMESIEKATAKQMKLMLKSVPIYRNWLIAVRGVGEVLTGKILRYVDFERAKHVSSLYKYAGLIVDENGKAMKRSRGGNLGYNPKFKTTLFILATVIEKQNGKKSGYRKLYDMVKQEEQGKAKLVIDAKDIMDYVGYVYEDKPITKKRAEKLMKEGGELEIQRTKAHIRMRTLRKVEKVFLGHLYIVHEYIDIGRVEVHYMAKKDGWIYMPVIDWDADKVAADGHFDWWFELKDKYKEMGIRPVSLTSLE